MERQEDKVWSSRNSRLGTRRFDLEQVLSEWSSAKTCTSMLEVHVLVDNWDIRKVNLVNLKSAAAVALLLLPPEFSEEDLYAKICSLSYVGDLRMLFAEDKSKDYCPSATTSLYSSLPWIIQRRMAPKLSLKHQSMEMSTAAHQIRICREEAANCIRKVLRRKVMVSSARQAVSGVLAAGGVNAARYLVMKMSKAWKSRTSSP